MPRDYLWNVIAGGKGLDFYVIEGYELLDFICFYNFIIADELFPDLLLYEKNRAPEYIINENTWYTM